MALASRGVPRRLVPRAHAAPSCDRFGLTMTKKGQGEDPVARLRHPGGPMGDAISGWAVHVHDDRPILQAEQFAPSRSRHCRFPIRVPLWPRTCGPDSA